MQAEAKGMSLRLLNECPKNLGERNSSTQVRTAALQPPILRAKSPA